MLTQKNNDKLPTLVYTVTPYLFVLFYFYFFPSSNEPYFYLIQSQV